MKIGAKTYDISEAVHEGYGISLMPALPESVQTVLAASEDDEDGRSEWLWVRLPNGDLILGVYPQGDTYFATEHDHSRETAQPPSLAALSGTQLQTAMLTLRLAGHSDAANVFQAELTRRAGAAHERRPRK